MATDLDRLQGVWRVTALRMDGRDVAAGDLAAASIAIDGDRFVSKGMGAVYEGTLHVKARATPKAFDMLFTAGHAAGVRNVGIYKLDRDTWTICLATRGTKRPGRFASTPGSGIALETLTRNAGPDVPSDVTRREPVRGEAAPQGRRTSATPLDGEWQMTAGVFNGAPMSADMVRWCKRITAGRVTTVIAGPQTMLKAAFTIDTSASPHRIDYENLEGSNARKKQAGIFRVDGDALEICMGAPGKPRPSAFASKKGDGRSYTVWKRER